MTTIQIQKFASDLAERVVGDTIEVPTVEKFLNDWLAGKKAKDSSAGTIVRYGHSNQDGWWGEVKEDSVPWFQVVPLNVYAHGADIPSNDNNTKLSELVFVSWLYEMRGRKIPQDIVDTITNH